MAHIIEGTWDEIKQYEAAFAGHRLRVIIDPIENDEEEDLAAGMPPPPFCRLEPRIGRSHFNMRAWKLKLSGWMKVRE